MTPNKATQNRIATTTDETKALDKILAGVDQLVGATSQSEVIEATAELEASIKAFEELRKQRLKEPSGKHSTHADRVKNEQKKKRGPSGEREIG